MIGSLNKPKGKKPSQWKSSSKRSWVLSRDKELVLFASLTTVYCFAIKVDMNACLYFSAFILTRKHQLPLEKPFLGWIWGEQREARQSPLTNVPRVQVGCWFPSLLPLRILGFVFSRPKSTLLIITNFSFPSSFVPTKFFWISFF